MAKASSDALMIAHQYDAVNVRSRWRHVMEQQSGLEQMQIINPDLYIIDIIAYKLATE